MLELRPAQDDVLLLMDLRDQLAGALAAWIQLASHPRMGERAASIGLEVPPEEQGVTKAMRADRAVAGKSLPALIPQVYLHYDPAIIKYLRHRLPLQRQRMDFLLLLPERQRVLIEVDGKHHFAEGERASLRRYADMVSADRELRLAGYEIYRFGANELVGPGAAPTIERFFRRLFDRHGILPAKTVL